MGDVKHTLWKSLQTVQTEIDSSTTRLIVDFLVACYATLHPALSVRPSVRPSVTLYFFGVYGVFGLTASAQMFH